MAAPFPTDIIALRRQLDKRMAGLRQDRESFLSHWRDLSRFLLPRRGRWLATPNQANRGSPVNQNIINSTATLALRVLTSGLIAGITSPARPWFRLTVPDPALADRREVKLWLAAVQKCMLRVFAKSNLYNALVQLYEELAVFGTGVMLVEEDHKTVIRCATLTAGQYFVANGPRGDVDTVYREFTMTVAQVVGRFGLEPVSSTVRSLYQSGELDREVVVCHAVEPNDTRIVGARGAKGMAFRSVYWERGTARDLVLEVKGFEDFPACAPRWHLLADDAYGRSPGMDALGDTKAIQVEEKIKAQAIAKMAKPPLIADSSLKNEATTTQPDGITYVPNAAGVGIKPVYQVALPISDLVVDIRETQQRIRECFFADLFLMISQLDNVRTATEITERRQEKLLQLGPVLERLHNELLDPLIERVFSILVRASRPCWAAGRPAPLPPPPPELADMDLDVDYVSTLADAQRAVDTTGIERLVGFVGNLAAAKGDVLDGIDFDTAITEYADMLGVSPKLLVAAEQVAAIRADRAKQQQAAAGTANAMAAVQGAQTLSQTEVGGGQNALQAMFGGAM